MGLHQMWLEKWGTSTMTRMRFDMSEKMVVDVMVAIVKINQHQPLDINDILSLNLVSGELWRNIEHDEYWRELYEKKSSEIIKVK